MIFAEPDLSYYYFYVWAGLIGIIVSILLIVYVIHKFIKQERKEKNKLKSEPPETR